MRYLILSAPLFAATIAAPASAEVPEPVQAMIDAAIKSGDADTARTVIGLARQTNPDDAAELDAQLAAFDKAQAQLTAEQARQKQEAIRTAGLFENWDGKGEIGAFRATGNSSETGVTANLALTRRGIDWRHKLRGRTDYQRSSGVTTREQFQFAYEPNYRINHRAFVYALAQYERDRFQGFSARYSLSGGLGYDLIANDAMQLSVKAGPAWRRTKRIAVPDETNLAGLTALDFSWSIAEGITLTEAASAFVQSGNSSLVSETGIQAAIASDFSVRLSYTVEHDTDPPAGAVQTDTLSRVTLIYDF